MIRKGGSLYCILSLFGNEGRYEKKNSGKNSFENHFKQFLWKTHFLT